MKIVCLAKLVPDPRSPIKVLADASGIDRAGLKQVCDPFDEFGIELAIQLKEKRGNADSIAALAAGPHASADALRHALAMGCDRAVHLVDDALPLWDELRLASSLAGLIRHAVPDFDLILCGKQNIDNDAGELGPALAELLGLPHVGAATRFEISADARAARVHRRIEGAEQVVDAALPALVTIEKGLVEPRRPALARLMKAKQLPIDAITPAQVGVIHAPPAVRLVKLAPPPSRPACTMIAGEPTEMARELVRRLREEAKVI